MVLEAGERLAGPGALEQDVADHAPLAGDGVQRQQAGAGQLDAAQVAVVRAEQLVAAADGEERGAALDRVAQRLGARREVRRDELLLAVLAAADVEEVDVRRRRVAQVDRDDLELVPARLRPCREHGDVAAVGVDVEVARVEVPDADLHGRRSQNSATCPRSASRPRRESIAV